jgi:hypothetical protein
VHSKVTDARKKYEKTKFQHKNSNPKAFFSYVNNRTNCNNSISILKVDNIDIVSDYDKADALSNQYKSVFTIDNGILLPFQSKMPPNALCNIYLSVKCIVESIREMNGGSAPGLDGIHTIFLTRIYPYLVKPLQRIFKCSLDTGTLPTQWKEGVICPIYKSKTSRLFIL